MISTRTSKSLLLALAFSLVLAGCSGDDDAGTTAGPDDETTTTGGGDSTTTPTETTTTAGETTTTGVTSEPPPSPELSRAQAKAEAAEAVLPEDYTSSIEAGDQDSGSLFRDCLEEGEFNINELEPVTAAVVTMSATGPPQETGLPGPTTSVEARVFNSEAEATAAFDVLTRIFGTEDGRLCIADAVTSAMTEQAVEGVEIEFAVEALDLVGADVGARFNMTLTADGETAELTIDLGATREGDLTTYGSFSGVGEVFPADLATALMTA